VANVDQLVIVVAGGRSAAAYRLHRRCLVAAYDAEIHPLLCLTKVDLDASPKPLLDY